MKKLIWLVAACAFVASGPKVTADPTGDHWRKELPQQVGPLTYREWLVQVERLLNSPNPIMRVIGKRIWLAGYYATRWFFVETPAPQDPPDLPPG